MKLKGLKPLGFKESDTPEQNFLYRTARFLDKSNFLEFFESAVTPEPPLSDKSSKLAQVYYGRFYASQWLFRLESAKTNRPLWDTLRSISDHYRALLSNTVNYEMLESELKEAKEKLIQLECVLKDQITKAALTYSAIENPNIQPEKFLTGEQIAGKEVYDQLNVNARLYS